MNRTYLWLKERLCQNTSRNRGFATIWYMIAIVAIVALASFVISKGYANIQQHKIKSAMNRAVKAAVQQYDEKIFRDEGKIVFFDASEQTEENAFQTFVEVLGDNLGLDNQFRPRDDSMFSDGIEFYIVDWGNYGDDKADFPVTVNGNGGFKHTFHDPGIFFVLMVKVPELWGNGTTTYYVPAVAEVDLEISGGENE